MMTFIHTADVKGKVKVSSSIAAVGVMGVSLSWASNQNLLHHGTFKCSNHSAKALM